VTRKVDGCELSVGYLDRLGIFVFVQLCSHPETGVGRSRGNQLDDGAIATQRLAASNNARSSSLNRTLKTKDDACPVQVILYDIEIKTVRLTIR
jgi:hypothetical protein